MTGKYRRCWKAARAAGAGDAGYTMLRLPYGVKDVFAEWLKLNFPEKLERILGTVREVRGGKLNVSDFGTRMRGEGPYAEQIGQMLHVFRERLGFGARTRELRTEHFRRPGGTAAFFNNRSSEKSGKSILGLMTK